jgi:RimJ/RimL family protein N-acetyltransferase
MELKTARTVLRPVTIGDAPELHQLWTGAGVRRFLWDGEIIPEARTSDTIARSERMFAERRHGLWTARDAGDRRLIGFAGLWPFRDPPDIELVYGVGESYWGQGYAAELARGVIGYCFTALDMPAIAASTDQANVTSIRVLEKLGFRLTRRAAMGGLDTVFFELRRE